MTLDPRTESTRRRDSGFTLIELLIVVAIIGIIAAIAIPQLMYALDRARQATSAAALREFGVALQSYYSDNEMYPRTSTVDDLMPELQPFSTNLKSVDAWRNPLQYETTGTHYTIQCFGKDGIDGGDIDPTTRNNFTLDIVYSDGGFVAGIE